MADEFDSFISKVQGYHKAIEEEYEVIATEDVKQVRTIIDKKVGAALPQLVDELLLIAHTGDTDNAKLNAIKFAFNYYFKDSGNAEDPFSKMLEQLMNEDKQKEDTDAKASN